MEAMNNATRVLALFFASAVLPSVVEQSQMPVLDLPGVGDNVYYGTIKETDTIAVVTPEIRVIEGTGPVCSYVVTPITKEKNTGKSETTVPHSVLDDLNNMEDESLESDEESSEDDLDEGISRNEKENKAGFKKAQNSDLPFRVEVIEKSTGKAVVRLNDKKVIDCKDNKHTFKIAPKRCDGKGIGKSAFLKVQVIDVNNHDPEFQQYSVALEVDEGSLVDNLVTLNGSDADCGHPNAEICQYHILEGNRSLFQVSKSGTLRNVKPLNHSISRNHTLSIVAEDCGMRRSKPVKVDVKVKPRCIPGLQGIDDNIQYAPGSGMKRIAVQGQLELCGSTCQVQNVEGKVVMERLSETGPAGCDREYYNAKMLQEICGADMSTVDLLPSKNDGNVQNMSSSAEDILPSTEVYTFDGMDEAITVPPETTNPHISDNFTLSFWMRHGHSKHLAKASGSKLHGVKETILCSSDENHHNRRHFAVYVRNCKLELLIRREKPNKPGESELQPAEWRWHLPETCDNQWHHYSLNMKFPQVEVYLDGKKVESTSDKLEILDDWPLHVVEGTRTKLVVGACWHGADGKMAHHFTGHLAELTYLAGKNERPNVLPCALQCKEQLDFTNLDHLKSGQEAVFNSDMSQLTLKSSTIPDYVEMLRKVGYINHKVNPTVGTLMISISTSVSCSNGEKIEFPVKKIPVNVKKEEAGAMLVLEGRLVAIYGYKDAAKGIRLFSNINISMNGSAPDDPPIDHCEVSTNKPLLTENEYFSLPATVISAFGMELVHSVDGVVLKGARGIKPYEEALRHLHFYGKYTSGDEIQWLEFTVRCEASSQRLSSNEFLFTMVIGTEAGDELNEDTWSSQLGITEANETEEKIRQASASGAAAETPSNMTARTTTTTKNVINGFSPTDKKPAQPGGSDEAPYGEKRIENANDDQHNDTHFAMNNIPMLLGQEEIRHRGHRLTLEKLAADAPRPNLGAPLPLVHSADMEEPYGNTAMSGTGSAVAIVIVVCVGFLLLLIVIGIMKIRTTHNRMLAKHRRRRLGSTADGEVSVGHGELAWDDGAMNITVNPIEDISVTPESRPREDEYSESMYDDDVSYIDEEEECSDDEECEGVLPHIASRQRSASRDSDACATTAGGLEWDDTTLVHSATQPNLRSQTYRV